MEVLFGVEWRERGRAFAAGHSCAVLHYGVHLLYLLLQAILQSSLQVEVYLHSVVVYVSRSLYDSFEGSLLVLQQP